MANITTTTDENNNKILNVGLEDESSITLATANTYVDKNIIINIKDTPLIGTTSELTPQDVYDATLAGRQVTLKAWLEDIPIVFDSFQLVENSAVFSAMTVGQQGSLESVFSLNVENLSNKETKDSSLMTIFGIATITGALESNTWSDIIYDEILGESYLVEILDEIIPQVDKTLKIVDDAADAKATGDAVKSVIYIGEQEPDNEYTQLWIKRNGENTEESIPTITLDKTLTVEDTAADAKAVGDRLAPLEEALSNWFNIARLKIYNEEDSSILEESYPDLNSELKLF